MYPFAHIPLKTLHRHPDIHTCMFVASDTLHILPNVNPEFLSNQKLHSFLAIQLPTLYQAQNAL